MSDMLASALIMTAEAAVVFAMAFGIISIRFIKRWRSDRSVAKDFVDKLREEEPAKNLKRIEILKEKYGLENEVIQPYIEEILVREKSLYSKIVGVFLNREGVTLKQFDDDIEALINACYVPVANAPNNADDGEVEISVDSEEITELRTQNNQLKLENEKLVVELEDAKKQSEEMLAEYVMMYGKEGEQERSKVDEEREKVKNEINNKDDTEVAIDEETDIQSHEQAEQAEQEIGRAHV